MAQSTASARERRRQARGPKAHSPELRLIVKEGGGGQRRLVSMVLDQVENGVGVSLEEELAEGIVVGLEPSRFMASLGGKLPPEARVMWCRRMSAGHYRAGLHFLWPAAPPRPEVAEAQSDFYEALQVHPGAHPDTIQRVYRHLAQRYHPDNKESGDEEKFRLITRAYHVLMDPEQRAGYDLQHRALHANRQRLLEHEGGMEGPAAERAKRRGLLLALYRRRLLEPGSPTLSIFDLEEVLGVPREHLEFALWYMREKGMASRSDNNRYQITAAGVDELERIEEGRRPDEGRLLNAPE